MSDHSQNDPAEWGRNIDARMAAGLPVPMSELNEYFVACGEEPIAPMTPAEAEAELFRLTGFTMAEIDEMRVHLQGRRYS